MKHTGLFVLLVTILMLSACGPSAAGYNNDGNKAYAAEKYDEALKNYTSAQHENPDLAEPYYNAGSAFHRKDDFEAAIAQTQQSLRAAKGDLAEQGFYNLGNNFFKLEDWPKAIEAYKDALRLKPDDADAKHNLELALKIQQQQQQQQQQGQAQGDPQQQQGQGGGQQQQQQQGGQQGDQPQQQGGGQQEQQQNQGQSPGGSQPQEQPQSGSGTELSPGEAQQLLDALGQNSQTLQERLNQTLGDGSSQGGFGGAPKPLPVQDW